MTSIHNDGEKTGEVRLSQPFKHMMNLDIATVDAQIALRISVAREVQEFVVAFALQEVLDLRIYHITWSGRHVEVHAGNAGAVICEVTIHELTVCNDAFQIIIAT